MRKFAKITKLGISLILVMSLVSCGNNEPTTETVTEITTETTDDSTDANTEENEIKETQDYINIAVRPMQSFNPLTNTDVQTMYVLNLIYDNLFYRDETLKATSNIVEDPVFSEDGLSASFVIKSDAKWHNGDKITVDDIVYSLNTLKNNQNPLFATSVNAVNSISRTGDSTFVMYFKKPTNIHTLNLSFPIVQKGLYDNLSSKDTSSRYVTNGSGKYELEEVNDSRNFTLKASDKYASANIQTINLIVIESFDLEVDAYNAGIVDIIFLKPDDLKNIRTAEDTTIINIPTNEYEFIAFNFQNPFLNDINIRRALAYAIPTDETIQSMYLNAADRTHTNVNPKSYLYNSSVVQYSEDFEQGKNLLKGVGYEGFNSEGYAVKANGDSNISLDFNILVNQENTYRVNLARKYSENLKAIGVKSQVVAVPYDEYMDKLKNGNYDLAFVGYLTDESQNNSSLFAQGNILRYNNAEIIEMQKQLATANPEIYVDTLNALQTEINTELPVISVCYKNILMLANHDITNVNATVDNYFNNIENWIVFE